LGTMVFANLQLSVGIDIKLINALASIALIALAIFLVVMAWVKTRSIEVAEPPLEVL